MNNLTGCKQLFKRITSADQSAKKVPKLGIRKKILHKQNSLYGQYLIQESKDIDRTVKGLERILIQ